MVPDIIKAIIDILLFRGIGEYYPTLSIIGWCSVALIVNFVIYAVYKM